MAPHTPPSGPRSSLGLDRVGILPPPGARVGVVGDFQGQNVTHRFTNAALQHLGLDFDWVPTESVGDRPEASLGGYDGLWIAPASPYRSMVGALEAIRHARERAVPLVGT